MSSETQGETLRNVLTERELCELLGMNKEQVGVLRRAKGLPFIKLTDRARLYFEADLVDFFRRNRVILNRAEMVTDDDVS